MWRNHTQYGVSSPWKITSHPQPSLPKMQSYKTWPPQDQDEIQPVNSNQSVPTCAFWGIALWMLGPSAKFKAESAQYPGSSSHYIKILCLPVMSHSPEPHTFPAQFLSTLPIQQRGKPCQFIPAPVRSKAWKWFRTLGQDRLYTILLLLSQAPGLHNRKDAQPQSEEPQISF
jgi:hypothetical protein